MRRVVPSSSSQASVASAGEGGAVGASICCSQRVAQLSPDDRASVSPLCDLQASALIVTLSDRSASQPCNRRIHQRRHWQANTNTLRIHPVRRSMVRPRRIHTPPPVTRHRHKPRILIRQRSTRMDMHTHLRSTISIRRSLLSTRPLQLHTHSHSSSLTLRLSPRAYRARTTKRRRNQGTTTRFLLRRSSNKLLRSPSPRPHRSISTSHRLHRTSLVRSTRSCRTSLNTLRPSPDCSRR
jgi:hypothetical protein